MSWIHIFLGFITAAGAIFAVALAALQKWIPFMFFLVVYVIGVTALTVQVVT